MRFTVRFVAFTTALAAPVCLASCGSHDAMSGEVVDGIEGHLEVRIEDYDDGSARTHYALQVDPDRTVTLETEEEFGSLASGDRVVVFGERVMGGGIRVDHMELAETDDHVGVTEQALRDNAVRTRSRAAALLVHWDQPDGMTPERLRSELFGAADSTAQWNRENSYDLVELSGDAFGWFRIAPPSGCDHRTIAARASAAARSVGVDLDAYDHLLYYFPHTSQCRWSALATVGRPFHPARDSWYNGRSGCIVLSHELLHNYGARHSRSYRCSGGRAIAGPASCDHHEYGDRFDVMGRGCFHTNNYQKAAQGWFGECNTVTVNGDGTFDVVPTQTASDGVQALRIPAREDLCPPEMSRCFYTVEYRQPRGNIEGHNASSWHVYRGVLVHLVPPVDFAGRSRPTNPYLLDMHPATRTLEDAALLPGETFEDPAGVRIRVVSADDQGARVQVALPGGGTGGAVCIDGTPHGDSSSGDATPPEVTLLSPEDGATRRPRTQMEVQARVTDEHEVARAELVWTHGGQRWVVGCDTAEGAFECYRSGSTYTWTVNVGRAGTRAWHVRGIDASGNAHRSPTRRVEVRDDPPSDGDAPRVEVVFPGHGATLSRHGTVHVRARAEAPDGVVAGELVWWRDGTTTVLECEAASGPATCTRTGDVFTWSLRVGGGRTRLWRVRVTGEDGQETTSSWRRLNLR